MSFLFGTPKLSREELGKCLTWLGQQYKFTGFQTKEADLHNNVVAKYGNSLGVGKEATTAMLQASTRQILAATEILSRMDRIYVPEAAALLHNQWRIVMNNFLAYSQATYTIMEALGEGLQPVLQQASLLRSALEDSRMHAEKEEKKFLKRLYDSGATMRDVQQLITNAERAVSSEAWQPRSSQ